MKSHIGKVLEVQRRVRLSAAEYVARYDDLVAKLGKIEPLPFYEVDGAAERLDRAGEALRSNLQELHRLENPKPPPAARRRR